MEVVDKDSGELRTVPIEDIGIVVAENQRVMFTLPVLNALADNNTVVVLCNEKKMPNAIILPCEGNTIQSEVQHLQDEASEPLRKQLWKQIITAKIKNQASVLSMVGRDGEILKPMYSNVNSGDSTNREGVAARLYWNKLFDEHFLRDQEGDDALNAMLNYGYAILRSAVARALIGSGLNLSYGLFHKNRYNAFPLADDIMEPYRPYVDLCVYELWENGCEELNREAKIKLMEVLTCDVSIGECLRPLELALSFTSASLVRCVRGEIKQLVLPRI